MDFQAKIFPDISSALELAGSEVKKPWLEKLAPLVLLALDGLCFTVGMLLAKEFLAGEGMPWDVVMISLGFSILFLHLVGGHDRKTQFLSLGYTSEHLVALSSAALISYMVVYTVTSYQDVVKPSRLLVPISFALFAMVSLFVRRRLGGYYTELHRGRSVLIVGRETAELDAFFKDYGSSGFNWGIEVVSPDSLEDRLAVAREQGEEYEVIVLACTPEELNGGTLQKLVQFYCADVPLLTLSGFHEKHWRRVNFNSVRADWLFNLDFRLSQGSVYSHAKRVMDVIVSAVALAVTSPLILIAAVLIRLESKGGAFFKQERIGRNGRPFMMYKLRTMKVGRGDIYTAKEDPRVTRCGRFLRSTRLDELPQLWNVLKGEMSLIGPRAEWTKCVEIYEDEIPNYHLRHLAIPGITGWAQVNYSYGASKQDAIEKFQYDLYYIKYFSFKLDLCIVLKTVHVMLFGKGR